MTISFEEEANHRNGFIYSSIKNKKIPSYSLWDAESIAKESLSERIKWWNDFKKNGIGNGEFYKKIDSIINQIRNSFKALKYQEKDMKRFPNTFYCDI